MKHLDIQKYDKIYKYMCKVGKRIKYDNELNILLVIKEQSPNFASNC